ncbi:hypothetical protein KY385_04475 [Candidatus Parcubacteria bacterium]|nr:hypothetical protein [Candidatus Parcubacteria bacterium]
MGNTLRQSPENQGEKPNEARIARLMEANKEVSRLHKAVTRAEGLNSDLNRAFKEAREEADRLLDVVIGDIGEQIPQKGTEEHVGDVAINAAANAPAEP